MKVWNITNGPKSVKVAINVPKNKYNKKLNKFYRKNYWSNRNTWRIQLQKKEQEGNNNERRKRVKM